MTHLFGGSSGREGAALLLGGSVSGQVGRALHLENRDCRLMTMCGMAGAFSAIFGTPLAATIFTLEVVDVGSMQYAALLPCLVSALLGVFFSGQMGLPPEAFVLKAEVAATPPNLVRVIVLGALLAALSIFFCELLHAAPRVYAKLLPNPYLRVAVGGVLIAALTTLLGTTDYNGAGGAVVRPPWTVRLCPTRSFLKMLFTSLTLGAGFKGGEIVPIFFTGATFGCVAAPLLGLPPQLGGRAGYGGAVLRLHQQPAGVHLSGHRGIRRAVHLAVCAGVRGFLYAVQLFQPLPGAALPALQTAHCGCAAGTRPLVRDGRPTFPHKR